MIAHVPNTKPQFVPISPEILEHGSSEVVAHLRDAICSAIGFEHEEEEDEPDFCILFGEKILSEEDEKSATVFKEKLETNKMCTVRVIFRLLGGKGGFGALLKKQGGRGKKTKNFDAMRDLTGRRLRHSYAVDRIKEWMEKKQREDDLVNMIAGEGPELPKPVPASESLDPEFIKKLKRSSADRPAVVSEGMRVLDASEEQDALKRPRVNAGSSSSSSAAIGEPTLKSLGAMDMLGDLGSSSPSPDGEDSQDGEEAHGRGSAVVSGSSSQPSSSTAATKLGNHGDLSNSSKRMEHTGQEGTEPTEDSSSSVPQVESSRMDQLLVGITAPPSGSASERASSRGNRGTVKEKERGSAAEDVNDAKLVGPEELKDFANADDLAAKVSAETIKQSLQKFGLKCGGKPEDRVARLFLLKDTPLKDLPKSAFASK